MGEPRGLPPAVWGRPGGRLALRVDEVFWAAGSPGRVSVQALWWGDRAPAHFRPLDVTSRLESRREDEVQVTFDVRTSPGLFEAYLRNCEKLIFHIYREADQRHLGKSTVRNLESIVTYKTLQSYYPIFNASNMRIGDLHVCFSLSLNSLPKKQGKTEEPLKRKVICDKHHLSEPLRADSSAVAERPYRSVSRILSMGKELRNAMVKSVLEDWPPENLDGVVSSSFRARLPPRKDAKLVDFLLGKELTSQEEEIAVETLRCLSPAKDIIELASPIDNSSKNVNQVNEHKDCCMHNTKEKSRYTVLVPSEDKTAHNVKTQGRNEKKISPFRPPSGGNESHTSVEDEELILKSANCYKLTVMSMTLTSVGIKKINYGLLGKKENIKPGMSFGFEFIEPSENDSVLKKPWSSKIVRKTTKKIRKTNVTWDESWVGSLGPGGWNRLIPLLNDKLSLRVTWKPAGSQARLPSLLGTASASAASLFPQPPSLSPTLRHRLPVRTNIGITAAILRIKIELGRDRTVFGRTFLGQNENDSEVSEDEFPATPHLDAVIRLNKSPVEERMPCAGCRARALRRPNANPQQKFSDGVKSKSGRVIPCTNEETEYNERVEDVEKEFRRCANQMCPCLGCSNDRIRRREEELAYRERRAGTGSIKQNDHSETTNGLREVAGREKVGRPEACSRGGGDRLEPGYNEKNEVLPVNTENVKPKETFSIHQRPSNNLGMIPGDQKDLLNSNQWRNLHSEDRVKSLRGTMHKYPIEPLDLRQGKRYDEALLMYDSEDMIDSLDSRQHRERDKTKAFINLEFNERREHHHQTYPPVGKYTKPHHHFMKNLDARILDLNKNEEVRRGGLVRDNRDPFYPSHSRMRGRFVEGEELARAGRMGGEGVRAATTGASRPPVASSRWESPSGVPSRMESHLPPFHDVAPPYLDVGKPPLPPTGRLSSGDEHIRLLDRNDRSRGNGSVCHEFTVSVDRVAGFPLFSSPQGSEMDYYVEYTFPSHTHDGLVKMGSKPWRTEVGSADNGGLQLSRLLQHSLALPPGATLVSAFTLAGIDGLHFHLWGQPYHKGTDDIKLATAFLPSSKLLEMERKFDEIGRRMTRKERFYIPMVAKASSKWREMGGGMAEMQVTVTYKSYLLPDTAQSPAARLDDTQRITTAHSDNYKTPSEISSDPQSFIPDSRDLQVKYDLSKELSRSNSIEFEVTSNKSFPLEASPPEVPQTLEIPPSPEDGQSFHLLGSVSRDSSREGAEVADHKSTQTSPPFHTPQPTEDKSVNTELTPPRSTADSPCQRPPPGESEAESFKARVEVERAFNLPMVPNLEGTDLEKPSTYVTFRALGSDGQDKVYKTGIVPRNNNPIWDATWELSIPLKHLFKSQYPLNFTLHGLSGRDEASAQPSALVEITALCVGLPLMVGWYNLGNETKHYGQIKISVTPLEDLSHYKEDWLREYAKNKYSNDFTGFHLHQTVYSCSGSIDGATVSSGLLSSHCSSNMGPFNTDIESSKVPKTTDPRTDQRSTSSHLAVSLREKLAELEIVTENMRKRLKQREGGHEEEPEELPVVYRKKDSSRGPRPNWREDPEEEAEEAGGSLAQFDPELFRRLIQDFQPSPPDSLSPDRHDRRSSGNTITLEPVDDGRSLPPGRGRREPEGGSPRGPPHPTPPQVLQDSEDERRLSLERASEEIERLVKAFRTKLANT